jgi:hypothetical protein
MSASVAIKLTVVLPAATPTPIIIPLRYVLAWGFVVENDGANPITEATLAKCPGLSKYSEEIDWNAAALPLAAGGRSLVQGLYGERLNFVRITLTSPLGTTVTIDGGGE